VVAAVDVAPCCSARCSVAWGAEAALAVAVSAAEASVEAVVASVAVALPVAGKRTMDER